MRITALVKEKVDAECITMLDLLDLTDDNDAIHEWLCSDFWSDIELARIANEIAYGFFGIDGTLDKSDYEAFRFLLQVLPSPIFGVSSLEMIMNAVVVDEDDDSDGDEDPEDDGGCDVVEVEIVLDSASYLDFLYYLYRAEVTLLPGDPDRVFEYALAYGPEQAFDDFISVSEPLVAHEIMLNLARSEYYLNLGDAYYDMLAELHDSDLVIAVLQIIGDQAAARNAEIEDLSDMLDDAHDAIDDLCALAGIDPDDLDDDDASNDDTDDGEDVPDPDEPTDVSDLPAADTPVSAGAPPADEPAPTDGTPDPT